MIKRRFQFFAIVASLLLVAACSPLRPITNLHNQFVPALPSQRITSDIQSAAAARGWQTRKVKPGLIYAKLHSRGHFAEVSIPYSSKGYSILYMSSKNLNVSNGQIHRTYNRWILNLNQAIQLKLQKSKDMK